MMKKLTISAIVVLSFAGLSFAQVVQDLPGAAGMIDWTTQAVKATGIGALNPKLPPSAQRKNALRAAQLDAMRNMVETLNGVVLSSETTVENAMMSSDVIKTRVEGIVKNFRFTSKPRYMSDGSVEVDMEMLLYGKVGDVLYSTPEFKWNVKEQPTFQAVPNPPQEPQPWTGLIVDASGVADAQPAMVPNILTESGDGIYGDEFVPQESAVKYGVVAYSNSVADAKARTERVGTNPLVIRAVQASGKNKADLVISDSDVETLATIADNTDVYDNCKVIIVLKAQ
jgi:hypothetical protein